MNLVTACLYRPVGLVVKAFAVHAGGREFDSRAGQIGHSVATDAMLLRSCAAQAPSRGEDEPRDSLHSNVMEIFL